MLTLIYPDDDQPMVLTKEKFEDFHHLLKVYPYAFTSVRFENVEKLIKFFHNDLGPDDTSWPFSRSSIQGFAESDQTVLYGRS